MKRETKSKTVGNGRDPPKVRPQARKPDSGPVASWEQRKLDDKFRRMRIEDEATKAIARLYDEEALTESVQKAKAAREKASPFKVTKLCGELRDMLHNPPAFPYFKREIQLWPGDRGLSPVSVKEDDDIYLIAKVVELLERGLDPLSVPMESFKRVFSKYERVDRSFPYPEVMQEKGDEAYAKLESILKIYED